MKLKVKVLLLILSTSIIIFVSAIGYVSVLFKNKALDNALEVADSHAREYANIVKADLNVDMDIARTIAYSILGYKNIPHEMRRPIYRDILKNIFIQNPGYLAVWTSFELKTFHPDWQKNHGRARCEVHKFYDQVVATEDTTDVNQDNQASTYYSIKQTGKETLTAPYFYSYTKRKEDNILMASVCAPIVDDGTFIGLSGMDIGLERFQRITDEIKPFEESYAFFIANNGAFIAHPNKKYINKTLDAVDFPGRFENNVLENIQNGRNFSYFIEDENGNESYISFASVTIGHTETPWSIGIVIPVKIVTAEVNKNFFEAILVGLFGLLILSIVTWLVTRYITKPLQLTTSILKNLAKGQVKESQKMKVSSKDEIGEIRHSVNTLIDGLIRTAGFAKSIGKGNLNADFEPLSKQDVLGQSLLDMRGSLQNAREEEKKRKELDKQVNWATQGIAKFGGILRQDNNNMERLSYNIISNLVNYLDAVQGAIFILNDEDDDLHYFEMSAAYAYQRKRFADKKIEFNEGLIGRCAYERKSIYLIDIPNEHVAITSGLGDSNPRSLLIVPLKLNEDIFGVIEIASYNHIHDYQIEFTEKIGESIASTISSVKINLKTAQLLTQSQEQAEEMTAQEEELRKNMEELQATQEEMARRTEDQEGEIQTLIEENEEKIKEVAEKELVSKAILDALNNTTYLIEYDFEGNILYANDYVAKMFGITSDNLVGTKHSDNMETMADSSSVEYKQFWFDLKAGKTITQVNLYSVNTEELWMDETYTPIFDNDGKPYKVLKIAHDITKMRQQEASLESEMNRQKDEKESQKRTIEKILKKAERQQEKLKEKLDEKQKEVETYLERINSLENKK